MSIAIMQPYVFPYIGYFQLIQASDIFVFYDDVHFINKGWINRNNILCAGRPLLFSIPCQDASQNRLIKDIKVLNDARAFDKIMRTVQANYRKAPNFTAVAALIERILDINSDTTIADLAISSVRSVCEYLGINRTFKNSSVTYTNQELKKADRLIDICHIERQHTYINPSGGKAIYTKQYFADKDVDLLFHVADSVEYPQFDVPFVPWLSIIDVLMFNTIETITNKLLPSFHLE